MIHRPDIAAIFRDGTAIDAALRRVARETALEHRQLGLPLIVWRDERVTEIPPEEIQDYLDECERKAREREDASN